MPQPTIVIKHLHHLVKPASKGGPFVYLATGSTSAGAEHLVHLWEYLRVIDGLNQMSRELKSHLNGKNQETERLIIPVFYQSLTGRNSVIPAVHTYFNFTEHYCGFVWNVAKDAGENHIPTKLSDTRDVIFNVEVAIAFLIKTLKTCWASNDKDYLALMQVIDAVENMERRYWNEDSGSFRLDW